MLKAKVVGTLVLSQINPRMSSRSSTHWLSSTGQVTSSSVPRFPGL